MSPFRRPPSRPYDPGEDLALRKAAAIAQSYAETARELGRSEKSVRERTRILRIKGFIVGYDPVRKNSPDDAGASFGPCVPFNLINDGKLIEATLAEGGFPLPVSLNGRTFWINANGGAWRHTPEGQMDMAA